MKLCSKCKIKRDISEFSKDKRRKDELKCQCKFCDRNYYINNRERTLNTVKKYNKNNGKKVAEYQKEYRSTNKDKINSSKYKYKSKKAIYSTYFDKLTFEESPKLSLDRVSLEVKCKYCDKYFVPNNSEVSNRIYLLNLTGKDGFLYCSVGCRNACPVYGQKKYPKGFKKATSREVQPELRKLVLERDNWQCQKCNKSVDEIELHCHHILPINESPVESADVTNCITLCKEHHKKAHKNPGCRFNELRC